MSATALSDKLTAVQVQPYADKVRLIIDGDTFVIPTRLIFDRRKTYRQLGVGKVMVALGRRTCLRIERAQTSALLNAELEGELPFALDANRAELLHKLLRKHFGSTSTVAVKAA